MSERSRRCLELLLYAATALLGGWLLLRFALPALAPFLLAFALAALMSRRYTRCAACASGAQLPRALRRLRF